MKTIIFIMVAMVMLSCNHLEKGTVLKKEYEPKRSYVSFIPMIIGKVTTLIPYVITDNEDFVLTVEGEYNGEIVHENVYVTKKCYEQMQAGSLWTKDETCSFTDSNNSKERR